MYANYAIKIYKNQEKVLLFKKTFKQFFCSSNCFRVIFALNVKIDPKSRNKNWVLA